MPNGNVIRLRRKVDFILPFMLNLMLLPGGLGYRAACGTELIEANLYLTTFIPKCHDLPLFCLSC